VIKKEGKGKSNYLEQQKARKTQLNWNYELQCISQMPNAKELNGADKMDEPGAGGLSLEKRTCRIANRISTLS